MSDAIDRAAEAIANEVPFLSLSVRRRVAHALDNAGLLVSPKHDAAVAAKALRGVARALDAEDSNEWADAADQEAVRIIRLIRDEADRIEGKR